MSFLNPWLLLGIAGISLPILAHLLNRFQVQHTDWAAMQFLNRSVRVRSRQLKLKDIFLLILRCMAVLLLVFALARPSVAASSSLAAFAGEERAAVIIAIDGSFSMRHKEDKTSRYQRAMEKVREIQELIRPGDPVTLVQLAGEHRVIARNVVYDPDRFEQYLQDLSPTYETLDLDSVPRFLKGLAADMKAVQKEIYLITDMQESDWKERSLWLQKSLKELSSEVNLSLVPITGGSENLAVTNLELVSGVLRRGTVARYRATVRNYGSAVVQNVRVSGMLNAINVDSKVIPSIAPGTSESISLFMPFREPGPVKISAKIDDDALNADNARYAVAVIRDKVAALCVEGSSESGGSEGSAKLIAAALRARHGGKSQNDLAVQTVSWVELPSQDLNKFDVVVLADIPDITTEQAAAFEAYVRSGKGLIWFGGDYVKGDVWNKRSALDGASLLPAIIEEVKSTSDALGVGRPMDPSLPDHPICRPLLSLPEDLLSETRFRKVLAVRPLATSTKLLAISGSDEALLLEHSLGRGHVFMFTTSASPSWNNMAMTPVFPMLMQQMVTYLTAREFETPRLVGDSLSLSYQDQPDVSDAVFDSPSGESVSVPVREHRNRYVALQRDTREVGFYMARGSLQAAGLPIAVNVNTAESQVKSLSAEDQAAFVKDLPIRLIKSQGDILAAAAELRPERSIWRALMLAGLLILLIESCLAEWLHRRPARAAAEGGED